MFDSFWRFFHGGHSGAVVFGLKVIWRSLKVISRSFWVIFGHFQCLFSKFALLRGELLELEDRMLDSFWRLFHSGHSGAVFFGHKVISRSLKVISRSFWVIFWHFHWVFSTYAHLFFSSPKCFFSPATGRDSLVKHIFWRRRKCERSEHFLFLKKMIGVG